MTTELIKASVYRTETGAVVTDSLRVASVFEKSHKNVIQAIRNLLAENSADCGKWFKETAYTDDMGRTQPMFEMNRDGFSLLAMGFTGAKALQFKIQFIQQFNRMEQFIAEQKQRQLEQVQQPFKIPETLAEALYLAADLAREGEQQKLLIAEQQKQIEDNKGYVLYGKACEASTDSILVRDFAKLCCQAGIPTGEKRLFQWFRDNGWLYQYGSDKNLPKQRTLDMGLFEVKQTSKTECNGNVRVFATPKITVKGQQYFLKLFLKIQIANN